jgi:hypothetical protein
VDIRRRHPKISSMAHAVCPRRRALLRSLLLVLLALFGLGCGASVQPFVPVAGVRVPAPEGPYTAAEIDLAGDAQRSGEVRVWSRGAYRTELEGRAVTLVHVGFELENRGSVPLQLDERRLSLDDVALADGTLQHVAPVRVEGNASVPPASTAHVDAYFSMPRRTWPDAVLAYRVAWLVQGEGRSYAERTEFESPRAWRWYGGYAYYPGFWGWYGAPYPYYFYPPAHRFWGLPYGYRSRVYGPRVLARPRVR